MSPATAIVTRDTVEDRHTEHREESTEEFLRHLQERADSLSQVRPSVLRSLYRLMRAAFMRDHQKRIPL